MADCHLDTLEDTHTYIYISTAGNVPRYPLKKTLSFVNSIYTWIFLEGRLIISMHDCGDQNM